MHLDAQGLILILTREKRSLYILQIYKNYCFFLIYKFGQKSKDTTVERDFYFHIVNLDSKLLYPLWDNVSYVISNAHISVRWPPHY